MIGNEVGNILELNNVSKKIGDFSLEGINLRMKRGYIMGFIGPNGSGKTTTIKTIMDLIHPDQGEINIFGLDVRKNKKQIKDKVGFVYDENVYYGNLAINEMKRVVAPLYSQWDDVLFYKLMKEFELNPKQKIDALSKGVKMKFALAMALSHHAELIIMDEPTAGLDPVFRSELLDILYYVIQDEEKAILFSTHITSDLEKIADWITMIINGKIVFSQMKDEIMERYSLVKGPGEMLDSIEKEAFIGTRVSSLGFEALTDKAFEIRKKYGDRFLLEKASLEDIMIFSTRKGKKGGIIA